MSPGTSHRYRTGGDPRRERALAGLGTFAWRVAAATAIAVAVAAGALRLYGSRSGEGIGEVARQAMKDAPAPSARPPEQPMPPLTAGRGTDPAAAVTSSSSAAAREPAAASAAEIARDVERRRAAGALREAVKRFEPCPGGDVRRTASIDGDKVVKLAREKEDGLLVEEWFDGDGRLREARVRRAAGSMPFTRTLLLDEQGRTLLDEAKPEGAGGAGAPQLDRRDPSGIFFGGAGCAR